MRLNELPTLGKWIGSLLDVYRRASTNSLHRVIMNKDSYFSTKLRLLAGADPELKTENGFNALHIAAFAGKPNAMHAILEEKVSVNQFTDGGFRRTALSLAGWSYSQKSNSTEVVKQLLAAGADPNWESRHGESLSPLDSALFKESPEKVEALLDAGAEIEESDLSKTENVLIQSMLRLHIEQRKQPEKFRTFMTENGINAKGGMSSAAVLNMYKATQATATSSKGNEAANEIQPPSGLRIKPN